VPQYAERLIERSWRAPFARIEPAFQEVSEVLMQISELRKKLAGAAGMTADKFYPL
jgi:hypothetical protein